MKMNPLCGSILQAGTCQILSLAENPSAQKIFGLKIILSPKFFNKNFWTQNCLTELHLRFSAKLRIGQVSACKMEPQSGLIFWRNHPPTPQKQRKIKNYFRRAQADLSHVLSMLCGVPTVIVPPINKVCAVSPFQYMFFPHPNCFSHQESKCSIVQKKVWCRCHTRLILGL